jgi:aspartyl-tRNA(Asn)/glutamyl-tRNA(Gln) amidotransferase subunit A
MAFFDKPVCDIVREVADGSRRCRDMIAAAFARIDSTESNVHAFCFLQRERAFERAEALDALSSAEKARMPLCGVPVAVKDNICTLDVPTRCASRILEGFVPPYDATVVEALGRAGAIVIGKTNLDEFAMGSSTETSACGPTRNPHDVARVPGGSSGGSAAAVAAGFAPLAIGSDTGGSIRQPASYCGVVGMKPTYGRVSRYGLVAFASSLDQIGPFAERVCDAGLLLSVIAGPDPRDSTCAGMPFADERDAYAGAVNGLRIGVPAEYFGEGLADSVRAAIEAVIGSLSRRGATIVEVSLPNVQYAIATYYILCTAEASSNLARYDGVKYGYRAEKQSDLIDMYRATREEGFGPEVKRRIMLGTYVLSSGYYDAYYLKAARVRTLIARDFEQAFESCDALVSPVAPTPAFRIGEKTNDPLQMYLNDIYTVSANLAGIPGISIPCGDENGLPIGVQFMAPRWREDTLLRLGAAVEMSLDNAH